MPADPDHLLAEVEKEIVMHQQSGWQIIYPKTPAGKQYVLDVPEASTAPGTGMILYQFNGGDFGIFIQL